MKFFVVVVADFVVVSGFVVVVGVAFVFYKYCPLKTYLQYVKCLTLLIFD